MTDKKTTLKLSLIPLLSAIGAGFAMYLSKHYYDLRAGTAGFNSICNINSTMNCDAVATSRFAELFPGLPLSSFVAGWFVALLIIGLMARAPDWRKEAVLAGTLMSGFASLYSIVLLIVMFGMIGSVCIFCLGIDAVNFALFGLFLWLARGNPFAGANLKKLQSYGWIVAASLVIFVVILRPSTENEHTRPSNTEIEYVVNQVMAKPPVEFKIPEGSAILGNPNAPITIMEFSDFQCPYCKRGAVLMNQLLKRYEGKLRVVFMPFPLDSSCNRLIQRAMHPYACALARAAHCSNQQGKFVPVYEKIFDEQGSLNADSAKTIPAAHGVDAKQLEACVASEEAKAAIAASIEEGIKAKVTSTPTFFMNGRMIEGVLPMEAWELLMEKMAK